MKQHILVALPCYNEAENIPALMYNFDKLNDLYGNCFKTKVVIIDDCSTDDTEEVVKNLRCSTEFTYVKHEQNKGLTGGINSAFSLFKQALESDQPPVAFGLMDGDNSHNPINFERMIPRINEGYDVIVASRYRPGSRITGVSWWRQILSAGLGLMFKLMRNIPGVRDYSCGFRLYSPNIINRVVDKYGKEVVIEKSFASMVEILVKCHLLGAICTEVPFLLRYDLKLGESKMPFKKTIIGNIKLLCATRGPL